MHARYRNSRRLIVGGMLLGLGIALGLWFWGTGGAPGAVDQGWNLLMTQVQAPFGLALARALNVLGGSWVSVLVPLAGTAVLLIARRFWDAAYLASALLTSLLVVQLLKAGVDRARPEDLLVAADAGSYPSGHTANATTLAVVLCVLWPRLWVAIVAGAWVLMMALSRTYLHAHWLSDVLGGMLVGAGIGLLVTAAYHRVVVRGNGPPDPEVG